MLNFFTFISEKTFKSVCFTYLFTKYHIDINIAIFRQYRIEIENVIPKHHYW